MGIGCLPVRHETPNLAFTPGKLIGSDRAPEQFVDRLDRDGVLDLHEQRANLSVFDRVWLRRAAREWSGHSKRPAHRAGRARALSRID
jgi:hypothetical protein